MALPKRKPARLSEYDYSTPGAYFVTICTKDRKNLFWDMSVPVVGAAISRPLEEMKPTLPLSDLGRLVDQAIRNIPAIYSRFFVDHYVIMPNHIHLILRIDSGEDGRLIAAPTISQVIGQMKRWVSRQAGMPLWQKSYHEHVIRNGNDYREIWTYIEENPAKWALDRYYSEGLSEI